MLEELFPGQLDRLAGLAAAAPSSEVPGHDLARPDVAAALRALLAHLHVYRTYVGRGPADRADRARLAAAATAARRRARPRGGPGPRLAGGRGPRRRLVAGGRPPGRLPVTLHLAPAAVERRGGRQGRRGHRLLPLPRPAGVGRGRGRPGPALARRARAARGTAPPGARLGSCGLNALSTHDTKRSADVRARLAALSEAAPEWEALVRRWHRRHVVPLGVGTGPDPHDELFFYQSLFGVWPADGGAGPELTRRLRDTMRKAARESKRRTSWIDPDLGYERALRRFVDAVLGDPRTRASSTGWCAGSARRRPRTRSP